MDGGGHDVVEEGGGCSGSSDDYKSAALQNTEVASARQMDRSYPQRAKAIMKI